MAIAEGILDIALKTMEENEAFWKMINTEKLIIYLIFILYICPFNTK